MAARPEHGVGIGGQRDLDQVQAAAAADADNLDRQLLSTSSCTDSATSPTYVEVTVTYPFSTITRYPGLSGLMNLSRSVRMSVVPATPSFH